MTSPNSWYGPLPDVAGNAGYADGHPDRVGFFTDTSVCIGCKACEVACKEWNLVPSGEIAGLSGMSYDNSVELSANTWRHVAFVEQVRPAVDLGMPGMAPPPIDATPQGQPVGSRPSPQGASEPDREVRWLMSSDVCKHCTHAACLDVCPTGSLFRTEFGTVVVQEDICNGCSYCISACPYGVLTQREGDGRVFKCTLCYDRLQDGLEPACAKACPTDSIMFGALDELHEYADRRVAELQAAGQTQARLYGRSPEDGVGGDGAFFLLLDEPEVYGLPPDPVVTTRDLPSMWKHAGAAALTALAGIALAFAGRSRS